MVRRLWGGTRLGWQRERGITSKAKQRDPIHSIVPGGMLVEVQGLQWSQSHLVLAEKVRMFLREHLLWAGSHH